MSYMKGSNEQTSKGIFYQTKTFSEKNVRPGGKDLTYTIVPDKNIRERGEKDVTLTIHLNTLIDQYQIPEIDNFLKKENPSSYILSTSLSFLLKKYNLGDENFYKILDLLLQAGASPDTPINFMFQENTKIQNISEKDNITLLMFGIMHNDIDLINILLKYNININKYDILGNNAIIYAIKYNHNDSTKILNLLVENKANINYSIQNSQNQYAYHSVFTLACFLDLPRITKYLLDKYVDVDFKIKPNGDTGLHICAKYGRENTLQVLLSCERINPEIPNNEGKRAVDSIPDNDKKNEIMKLFINYYNNKINMNNNKNQNNENNFGYQQVNQFNQMNKKNINNINSNANEQQNNNIINNINNNINNINNNNINNINNNNLMDNYKLYMNNVNMMNNGPNINNINNENSPQKLDNYNFNDSSDLSEEHEIREKQNKNIKKSHKNNNYFPQYNSIKLLNQKIYNNLLSNSNLNFNIEIPIELIKKKNKEKVNTLNNFFSPKINSTPLLNLDITDKCFDLEIKLNDLKAQIGDKNKKLTELKSKNEELDQIIKDQQKNLEEKNIKLNNIINTISENDDKIINLKINQQELKEKIPQDKLYQETNKDNKYYKELKFSPHIIEENEMFKILNKDLLDYQKLITEKINRKYPLIIRIIEDLKTILKTISQDYDIHIYGSYANGLCMPWSDLDLVLVNKNSINNNINNNFQENNNENILLEQNIEQQSDATSVANTDSTRETFNNMQNDLLLIFYYKLKEQPWIKQMVITENLSIKIIRIITVEAYSEINIDISVDSSKHNGLKCVNLIKSYLKEYTVLKPITIALKAILQSANLHNPTKGGLSSYGLILMVVSYIQSQKENFSLKNEQDLCGKIFYGFLKHYGIFFDFNKYLILTYPINETNVPNNDKESFLNLNHFSQEFIILDPLNNKNNVANSSFQYMNLKMAFMIAYMVTKEDCDCGCHYGKAVYENSFNSTEHSYLKRMLNSVRRFPG